MVFSKNFFTNNIYLFFSISVVLNIFKGLIPLILNTTEFNFFIFNFISLLPVLILISSLFLLDNLNYKNNKIFLINLGLLIIWLFLNLYKNFNTTAIVFFITHGVLCLYFVVYGIYKKWIFNLKEGRDWSIWKKCIIKYNST